MAIGVLSRGRLARLILLVSLAIALPGLRSMADDQITKNDGTVVAGQILGVSGDGDKRQVSVGIKTASGSTGKIPVYLSDIKSVTMTVPDEVTKLKGAAPADVVAGLEPIVKSYAGLPSDWVVNAMAQLAEAYGATGKDDLAAATYNDIATWYPKSSVSGGNKYALRAVAGQADLLLKQGKTGDAIAKVQPLIDEANKNLSPSQADGGLYASAYLVYGQALEAQKKLPQALEAYLTVKTMFYQNSDLADRADQAAKKLRDANPGLGVD